MKSERYWMSEEHLTDTIWASLVAQTVSVYLQCGRPRFDPGRPPGSGRPPGEGNGNPLQHSCLENPMDGGAWWPTVHGVAKSQIQLSNFTNWYLEFSLCGVLFCLGPCPMNYGSLPLVSLNYGLLLLNSGNSPASSWTSVLEMQPGNSMETGQ